MATDVVMPQMGESIAEGTIVRWIKKVGDQVDRDEPLFEISTDKVDAEIPSPAAGVIAEIRVQEGETVPVNTVVAVIGAAGDRPAAPAPASAPPAPASAAPAPTSAAPAPARAVDPPEPQSQGDGSSAAAASAPTPAPTPQMAPRESKPAARPQPQPGGQAERAPAEHVQGTPEPIEDVIRQRSSPLVRKIAQEHRVDISQLQGTGIAGRVTKHDILEFIESGRVGRPAPAGQPEQAGQAGQAVQSARAGKSAQPAQTAAASSKGPAVDGPIVQPGAPTEVVPMSVMRRKIAEHMIASRRTSAHVHSAFEVNFARIAKIREAQKAEYERAGAKLTYLSFIAKAVIDALRAVPVVNASVDGENIVYHKGVNLGIAVALDWGLIVPVIKGADEKNLLGLSRSIADLAARARSKHLKPDEVSGGTFTITNPGVFGALFGMPIINQPQVAILGVGHVEKRPVVIDDAIAIRPMAYLTLGYDHRIIDGAVADQFMSHVKQALENWDPGNA
jgi:pyruvate dehydrogenase E2 component (dihydrolipoamide acetyltransferase)